MAGKSLKNIYKSIGLNKVYDKIGGKYNLINMLDQTFAAPGRAQKHAIRKAEEATLAAQAEAKTLEERQKAVSLQSSRDRLMGVQRNQTNYASSFSGRAQVARNTLTGK